MSDIPFIAPAEREAERAVNQAAVAVLRQGVVCLKGAFSTQALNGWDADFRDRILASANRGAFPFRLASLGKGRHHFVIELHRAFNDPAFYANPWIYGVARALLEPGFILMTAAMAWAEPGAELQYVHRDQPLPTENQKLNAVLPPFSLTVAIPLVATNESRGGPELIPGSHLDVHPQPRDAQFRSFNLEAGDCMIWDSRCLHRGLPNRDSRDRPMILLYYQRPWFFNFPNYDRDSELKITHRNLERVPDNFRHLVDWVHRVFPAPCFEPGEDGLCECGGGLAWECCHGD